MQIYYINLARRADRRDFMEAQFEKLGLEATRIEAVTPEDLPQEVLDRYCDPRRPGRIPPAHYACSMSHARALALVAQGDDPAAVVLEDDVVISKRLPVFLREFESTRPRVDLLRLETTMQGIRFKPTRTELAGIGIFRPYSWEPGSGAYVVARVAASTILRSGVLQKNHVDVALFHPFGPLAVILRAQAVPALCCQTSESPDPPRRLASDIAAAAGKDETVEPPFAAQVLNRLRSFARHEFIIGAQRTFHQILGARKQVIPYLE